MPGTANILVSAGETSGDLHAAALLERLREKLPGFSFWGMGGRALEQAGLETLVPASSVEVMGLVEVLGSLWRVRKALGTLRAACRRRRPAAAILTDFADFHFRLARGLKRLGIPVVYFISPKLWAWRRGRVRLVKELVDLMVCVLPFEVEFYRQQGYERAFYAGNPLVDELAPLLRESPEEAARGLGLRPGRIVAVLPGSRRREIEAHSSPFLQAARVIAARAGPGNRLVVALPDEEKAAVFRRVVPRTDARLLVGRTRRLLRAARVALVASGTATLEAGLLGTPAVVAYRVHPLTYFIGRRLVRGVRFISLVNLVLGREVFPEYLQDLEISRLVRAMGDLWTGPRREEVVQALGELRARLGPEGVLERVAARVADLVKATG